MYTAVQIWYRLEVSTEISEILKNLATEFDIVQTYMLARSVARKIDTMSEHSALPGRPWHQSNLFSQYITLN